MKAFLAICWVVTLLATLVATFLVLPALLSSSASAPQQGAAGAMACALCVIPYVFTRAVEGMGRSDA